MFFFMNYFFLVGFLMLYFVLNLLLVVELFYFFDNKIVILKCKLNEYLKIFVKLNVIILKEKKYWYFNYIEL